MTTYICLQATYTTYQIGLFNNNTCLSTIIHDKKDASRDLVLQLDALLKQHKKSLSDLDFFSINQGPGPFTSLRVIITTANALAFATKIPLVGINSLQALLTEYYDQAHLPTIALLNAYNNDLYYAIQTQSKIAQGCNNSIALFEELKKDFANQQLRFIGNGAAMHYDHIKQMFGHAAVQLSIPQEASLQQIAHMALQKFNAKQTHTQLLPLYLKQVSYAKQT